MVGRTKRIEALTDAGYLTRSQSDIASGAGDFFLTACPGSGKTRTIAARFAGLVDADVRVAGTSYTNVGADRLRTVISDDMRVVVPPQSFVGTLHRLLLQYVFYPFGHLVMRCPGQPAVRYGASTRWRDVTFGSNSVRASVAKFSYRPDGSLRFPGRRPPGIRSAEEAVARGGRQAIALKLQAARAGFASPDDAMYWALQVLREHPGLCRIVASRFDEVIVDEAQDTSELQLACLECLSDSGGLASLVLIGDLQQSIFSFNGASPAGCEALATRRGMRQLTLGENHRSSQKICTAVARMSARAVADIAIGRNAACAIEPEHIIYPADEPRVAIDLFRARLVSLGFQESEAAVLARNNDLVDELNGGADPRVSRRVAALATAAMAVRAGRTLQRREVEGVDNLLAFLAWDDRDASDLTNLETMALRQGTMRVLAALATQDGSLEDWLRAARVVVSRAATALAQPLKHEASGVLRVPSDCRTLSVTDSFSGGSPTLRAQTVHDIKGEERDAILVVADVRRSRFAAHAEVWTRLVRGETTADEEAEEYRILYVALTRATRYAVVAIPDTTPGRIVNAIEAAGFLSATR